MRAIATKALLRVQFLLTFLGGRGEEQEALALLSKKGEREGSIESQQKFDFFSYDDTPNFSFSRNVSINIIEFLG